MVLGHLAAPQAQIASPRQHKILSWGRYGHVSLGRDRTAILAILAFNIYLTGISMKDLKAARVAAACIQRRRSDALI
jgi:hypothetical protein